jgi:uracil-DNA glycosylase
VPNAHDRRDDHYRARPGGHRFFVDSLLRDAKIRRSRDVVTWNVVPWYLGTDRKLRNAAASDLAQARTALVELLGLLPRVRVVVLIGKPARLGWEKIATSLPVGLRTIECPHASPTNINTRKDTRGKILSALVEARRIAYAA